MKKNKKLEKFVSKILERPELFFVSVAALLSLILFSIAINIIVSEDDVKNFKLNLLGEAFGLLFDLIILGALLAIYQRISEKNKEADIFLNQIDEFRHWKNEEAVIRMVGLVRKLNKLNISTLRLLHCTFIDAKLSKVNLNWSDLRWANFENADLHGSNLKQIKCRSTNFNRCNLRNTDLSEAYLFDCDFTDADLTDANLTNAWLINVNLTNTKLNGANLENIKVFDNWFEKINDWKVVGREEIESSYQLTGKTQTAIHSISTHEDDRTVLKCIYQDLTRKI